jgi:hypothetical protein
VQSTFALPMTAVASTRSSAGSSVITSKPAIHDHLKSGQRNSLRRQDSGPDDPCPGGAIVQSFPSPVSIGPTAYQSAGQGRAERAEGKP